MDADRRNRLYVKIRDKVILRSEPQYLDSHAYIARDTFHWKTYYVNRTAMDIFSASAQGAELDQIVRMFASEDGSDDEKPNLADSITAYVLRYVSKGVLELTSERPDSASLLYPLELPTVQGVKTSPMKFPVDVDLMVTSRCNLTCRHCLLPSTPHALPDELTLREIKSLLKDLDHLGIFMLRLSGGEPTSRPDFLDILEYAAQFKFGVRILTNGLLLHEGHFELLSDLYKTRKMGIGVNISLDGPGPESHEWMRRSQGSYEKALKAIERVCKTGVLCSVESMLCDRNAKHVERLVELLIDRGVKGLNIHPTDMVGKALENRDTVLTTAEMLELIPELLAIREKYWDKIDIEVNARHHSQFHNPPIELQYPAHAVPLPANTCQAGMFSMTISPNGLVIPCCYALGRDELVIGDIRRQSLEEVWRSDNWKPYRGGWEVEELTVCADCSRREHCSNRMCRVYPYVALGDFLGPMPECVAYSAEIRRKWEERRKTRGARDI